MTLLKNIKRVVESIENIKNKESLNEDDVKFAEIYKKHSDIPEDKLKMIIDDVQNCCRANEEAEDTDIDDTQVMDEDNSTDVIDVSKVTPDDAEHTDANKAESCQMTELDASEDSDLDEDEEELIISENDDEEDSDEDEELIISENDGEEDSEDFVEEDEDTIEDETEDFVEEDEDEGFDGYQDELDVVEEDAKSIDMNVPSKDNSDDAADAAAKEQVKEDNNGAKAAIANRDNKGAFSSDVDALTDYLNKY